LGVETEEVALVDHITGAARGMEELIGGQKVVENVARRWRFYTL
jgi:hypothetical protein